MSALSSASCWLLRGIDTYLSGTHPYPSRLHGCTKYHCDRRRCHCPESDQNHGGQAHHMPPSLYHPDQFVDGHGRGQPCRPRRDQEWCLTCKVSLRNRQLHRFFNQEPPQTTHQREGRSFALGGWSDLSCESVPQAIERQRPISQCDNLLHRQSKSQCCKRREGSDI